MGNCCGKKPTEEEEEQKEGNAKEEKGKKGATPADGAPDDKGAGEEEEEEEVEVVITRDEPGEKLGLSLIQKTAPDGEPCVVAGKVAPGSLAERSGLAKHRGQYITRIGDVPVYTIKDITKFHDVDSFPMYFTTYTDVEVSESENDDKSEEKTNKTKEKESNNTNNNTKNPKAPMLTLGSAGLGVDEKGNHRQSHGSPTHTTNSARSPLLRKQSHSTSAFHTGALLPFETSMSVRRQRARAGRFLLPTNPLVGETAAAVIAKTASHRALFIVSEGSQDAVYSELSANCAFAANTTPDDALRSASEVFMVKYRDGGGGSLSDVDVLLATLYGMDGRQLDELFDITALDEVGNAGISLTDSKWGQSARLLQHLAVSSRSEFSGGGSGGNGAPVICYTSSPDPPSMVIDFWASSINKYVAFTTPFSATQREEMAESCITDPSAEIQRVLVFKIVTQCGFEMQAFSDFPEELEVIVPALVAYRVVNIEEQTEEGLGSMVLVTLEHIPVESTSPTVRSASVFTSHKTKQNPQYTPSARLPSTSPLFGATSPTQLTAYPQAFHLDAHKRPKIEGIYKISAGNDIDGLPVWRREIPSKKDQKQSLIFELHSEEGRWTFSKKTYKVKGKGGVKRLVAVPGKASPQVAGMKKHTGAGTTTLPHEMAGWVLATPQKTWEYDRSVVVTIADKEEENVVQSDTSSSTVTSEEGLAGPPHPSVTQHRPKSVRQTQSARFGSAVGDAGGVGGGGGSGGAGTPSWPPTQPAGRGFASVRSVGGSSRSVQGGGGGSGGTIRSGASTKPSFSQPFVSNDLETQGVGLHTQYAFWSSP